ncbi:condensation domain-containing protein (plasmid) [Streptomyces sp. R39]|uniref:Condensation domain-containing protein n=1 Tax=Streptomyces sp. R39 TaxID=3238631 RepID=A0AB39R2S0_9ACTN
MGADRSRPVELVVGPLVRHVLIRESADSWLLCLRYHHVVVDGLGHTVHVRRIAAVYPALTAGVEPRPHDLVAEDAAYPDTPAFARDRAYWLERFADRPAPVSLGDRHTGTPAHRHTGTPAHRHTGTPAHRRGRRAAARHHRSRVGRHRTATGRSPAAGGPVPPRCSSRPWPPPRAG